jgi:hypothetical protein
MAEVLQIIDLSEESNTKEVYVDYRISTKTINPRIISSDLGISPTWLVVKGEKRLGKELNIKTRMIEEVWRENTRNVWGLSTKGLVKKKRVEDHFIYLLKQLEPQKEKISSYLSQDEEYAISFLIHWESFDEWGSFEIRSDQLSKISEFSSNIEFGFRGYCTPE